MEPKKIEYRKLKNKDYPMIIKMIAAVNELEKFFLDEQIINHFAYIQLIQYLKAQNYAQVAEIRGQVVGVLFANNPVGSSSNGMISSIREAFHKLVLLFNPNGRQVLKIYKNLNQLDEQLLEENNVKDAVRMVYMAVLPAMRGKGIEENLYEHMVSDMNIDDKTKVYSILDNFCNAKFYEKQGFQKVGTKEMMIQPKQQSFRDYRYLYINE